MSEPVILKMRYEVYCSVCVNKIKENENIIRFEAEWDYPVYICKDCAKQIAKLSEGL